MKIILIALAVAALPHFAFAQDLAAQRVQAQQVAAANGASRPAEIAAQLAEAYGAAQNTELLVAKARQLAEESPAEAPAIAAAATVFSPSSAVLIARTIAALPALQGRSDYKGTVGDYKGTVGDPTDPAAMIAAAVAAVAPESAAAIAAAVSAVAPASAAAVAAAVSSLAPGSQGGTTTTTARLPSGLQSTVINPANFRGGQATPTPTPTPARRPNSPSS